MSLSELLERVKAASGPDREIDEALARAFGWSPVENPTMAGGLVGRWRQPDGTYTGHDGVPRWSASIDAAVRWLEAVLPGFHVLLTSCGGPIGSGEHCLWRCSLKGDYDFVSGKPQISLTSPTMPTLPLAIIIAGLKAKIAEDKP